VLPHKLARVFAAWLNGRGYLTKYLSTVMVRAVFPDNGMYEHTIYWDLLVDLHYGSVRVVECHPMRGAGVSFKSHGTYMIAEEITTICPTCKQNLPWECILKG